MSRRQQLENIIIGTLLESNDERNYFDDCKCLVSQDMFLNEVNRRIYGFVWEMNAKGMACTDPLSIFNEYGEKVMDICADMMEVCTYYSFIHLKTEYNERRFIRSCIAGTDYVRTNVQFIDYVKQFVNLVYKDEEKGSN